MCGICGIYYLDKSRHVERATIEKMARTMRHRGPDDEGFFLDGSVALGHQRLSILDLTQAGRQPMASPDGKLQIVFNGEIYNYLELREDLVGRGHSFQTETDTEVLLHVYQEYGPDCVHRLIGMFAFAVWDSSKRRLFAARDHFGVKPFYYSNQSGCFSFASEIKALFNSGTVKPVLSPEGLADYLTFQFCLNEKTLFKGVYVLPPGHMMTMENGGTPRVERYWKPGFEIDVDHTDEYFEREMAALLADAVKLQLRADVPVGAHLSGGLDSSTVASLASEYIGEPVKVFSGGFEEGPQFNETRYAKLVAEKIGAQYFEILPGPSDFIESLPKLMYYMDEPSAGPGLFPQYFVSRLAADEVKVVLGGQGGDEMFGGYIRYLIAYLEQCLKGGIQETYDDKAYIVTFESILPNLNQLQGYEPLLSHFWKKGLFEDEAARYFRLIDRGDAIRSMINDDYLEAAGDYRVFEIFREKFDAKGCRSLISKMTWFDQRTMLPALLQVEDRTSMSVSLESRVPLLDHRVADFMLSIPPMIKFKGGKTKHLLRKVVRDIIPPEIMNRKHKMGFPVPLNQWLQKDPVRSFVRDTLLGDKARSRGFLQTEKVENLLESEQPYGRNVWGLLCLELWMDTFLDGDINYDQYA